MTEVPDLRQTERIMGTESEYALIGDGPDSETGRSQVIYPMSAGDSKPEYLEDFPGPACFKGFFDFGPRTYSDHTYAEYSTSELRSPLHVMHTELVNGESYIFTFVKHLLRLQDEGRWSGATPTLAVKRNLGEHGETCGMHENYLGLREIDIRTYGRLLATHMLSRNIWAGAGGVKRLKPEGDYVFVGGAKLSHLANLFSLVTTDHKPIINTRDEPLADTKRWQRVHITSGDGNMWPWPTFMKLATNSLVMRLVENGVPHEDLVIDDNDESIAKSIQEACFYDLKGLEDINPRVRSARIWLTSGEAIDPLSLQMRFVERCEQMAQSHYISDEERLALTEWRQICELLSLDLVACRKYIEWIGKLYLGVKWVENSKSSEDPTVANLNTFENMWCDLNPSESLGQKARAILKPQIQIMSAAQAAQLTPTRAMARGQAVRWILDNLPEEVRHTAISVVWDQLGSGGKNYKALNPYDADPEPWIETAQSCLRRISNPLPKPAPADAEKPEMALD